MTATIPTTEPKLAAPGKGLPFFQGLYARYVMFPRMMKHYDGAASVATLRRETAKIISLCQNLSEEDFATRVLIDPLPGLEDSSRYWSAAMVLEHLIICMRPMTQIATTLAAGQAMNARTSTADVKPKGLPGTTKHQWLQYFEANAEECATRLDAIAAAPGVVTPPAGAPKVWHPFFGHVGARGWVWVMGAHQITHRRQMQGIVAGLSRKDSAAGK
jgi:hypothetical protein